MKRPITSAVLEAEFAKHAERLERLGWLLVRAVTPFVVLATILGLTSPLLAPPAIGLYVWLRKGVPPPIRHPSIGVATNDPNHLAPGGELEGPDAEPFAA